MGPSSIYVAQGAAAHPFCPCAHPPTCIHGVHALNAMAHGLIRENIGSMRFSVGEAYATTASLPGE